MKRIVTIGGGTGQMAVLSGLRPYAKRKEIHLTAVVSMADNGGSTGKLRDELGVLPPGDVRKCLLALAEDSTTMRELFGYRFRDGTLAGHSFGNLFISALEKVTGSLAHAVEEASRVLRIVGTVLPVTTDSTDIVIDTRSKTRHVGERHLDDRAFLDEHGIVSTSLSNTPALYPKTRRALERADCIVIGPGDIHGSILPCLHVEGMKEVLLKNTRAPKILVVNATNKKGLTDAWRVSDYVHAVESALGDGVISDCIANRERPAHHLVEKYELLEGKDVVVTCDDVPHSCTEHYIAMLKKYPPDAQEEFIRHDEILLAQEILRICGTNDAETLHV